VFTISSGTVPYRSYADFDGDGVVDLLWRYQGTGGYQGYDSVWYLNSNGSLKGSLALQIESDLNWRIGGAGDLDRDGVTDIFWRYYGSGADLGKNRVWTMNGDGSVKGVVTVSTLADVSWVMGGVGDFDGDKIPDILWRYTGSGSAQGWNVIWYMNTNGTWRDYKILDTLADLNWRIGGTGDFDLDGVTDIVWRYYGSGSSQGANVVWYLNSNGTLKGTGQLPPITDTNWKLGAVGDLDGDGVPDLFWRYCQGGSYAGTNAYWCLNSNRTIKSSGTTTSAADLNWQLTNNGSYFPVGGGGAVSESKADPLSDILTIDRPGELEFNSNTTPQDKTKR